MHATGFEPAISEDKTIKLGEELCKEYTYRYGKIHKCQPYIEELSKNIPDLPDLGFTKPALAMPEMYKDDNVIDAYQTYYFFGKERMLSWKGKCIICLYHKMRIFA